MANEFKLPESLAFTAEDFNFDVTIEKHVCDPEPAHLAERANTLLTERWNEWCAKLETAVGDKWDSPQFPAPRTFFVCEKSDMPWVTHATKILPPWELGRLVIDEGDCC